MKFIFCSWGFAVRSLWLPCVRRGGVHTLCCRTHIWSAHTHASPCVCTCAHGSKLSKKVFAFVHVVYLRLAFSTLMYRPPSLLFPHGHFDSTFPSAQSLPSFIRPKSAKCTSARSLRSLATWPSPVSTQLVSPSSSTRPLLQTARRPATIRTAIASLTSRKPHARTLDCSVFPQCLKPLFRTFLMVILLFREKAEQGCLGRPLQDREKQRREKVRWSVLQSRCQRKVDGTALGVMLFRLTESCSDERDLREHLERRAQQAFIGETSVQRKLHATEYNMEIQKKKFRIRILLVTAWAWISKTTSIGS